MNSQIISKLNSIESQLKQNSEPISLPAAAQYLNISKSYLYKLTYTNRIAHYKPNGKKIYFLKSELYQWLTRNRVKDHAEIEREALKRTSGLS